MEAELGGEGAHSPGFRACFKTGLYMYACVKVIFGMGIGVELDVIDPFYLKLRLRLRFT